MYSFIPLLNNVYNIHYVHHIGFFVLYLLLKCLPMYSVVFTNMLEAQGKEEITETKSGVCVRKCYVGKILPGNS